MTDSNINNLGAAFPDPNAPKPEKVKKVPSPAPAGGQTKVPDKTNMVPPVDLFRQTVAKKPATDPVDTAKPEPPQDHRVDRNYLVVMGLVTLPEDRVLLPRQVVPFSFGWEWASEIKYVRWQIALRVQRCEPDENKDYYRSDYQVIRPPDSELAGNKSYMVSIKPDGCGGFTGENLKVHPSMTVSEIERLANFAGLNSWAYRPGNFGDPVRALEKIMPMFYVELKESEAIRLRESGNATLLRRVFDLTRDSWIWAYQLGKYYPGVGLTTVAPVVVSEQHNNLVTCAEQLHSAFGWRNILGRVYIGGTGIDCQVMGDSLQNSVELNAADASLIEDNNMNMEELLVQDPGSALALHARSVFIRLPAESKTVRKDNNKNKKPEKPPEDRDNFGTYIGRLINAPANIMANRLFGVSEIVGAS